MSGKLCEIYELNLIVIHTDTDTRTYTLRQQVKMAPCEIKCKICKYFKVKLCGISNSMHWNCIGTHILNVMDTTDIIMYEFATGRYRFKTTSVALGIEAWR